MCIYAPRKQGAPETTRARGGSCTASALSSTRGQQAQPPEATNATASRHPAQAQAGIRRRASWWRPLAPRRTCAEETPCAAVQGAAPTSRQAKQGAACPSRRSTDQRGVETTAAVSPPSWRPRLATRPWRAATSALELKKSERLAAQRERRRAAAAEAHHAHGAEAPRHWPDRAGLRRGRRR